MRALRRGHALRGVTAMGWDIGFNRDAEKDELRENAVMVWGRMSCDRQTGHVPDLQQRRASPTNPMHRGTCGRSHCRSGV